MSAALRLEEQKREYFSSINPMARKIMLERARVEAGFGPAWGGMSPEERDRAIDGRLMEPGLRARYAVHRVEREEVVCYPRLLLRTGQKEVHFGEEDITWQDEHSAPFSWETKSQQEFSLSSSPADQSLSASQADPKSAKAPHPSLLGKSTAGTKVCVSESRRPDEESSFWKISAERSRLDGGQEDFQSLTPSQIKSLEKGEKTLPSYLRQESCKDPEVPESLPPAGGKSTKQRAPRPPAPPPPAPHPPAAAPAAPPHSAALASISLSPGQAPPPPSVSSSVAGWERSQSTLPSASSPVDHLFSSASSRKEGDHLFSSSASSRKEGDHLFSSSSSSRKEREREREKEEVGPAGADAGSAFSQFNTSSNVLKTGFDFLDNW